MARYPTFGDYHRGNYRDGIKRCDDLLQKNPNDVELLTVKLQLVYATQTDDASPILEELLAIQPPISDLGELVAIEDAVIYSQKDAFPQPKTLGTAATKLWENASKASGSMSYKLDLQSLRFSRAIVNDRLIDAQQALIRLKVLQPKNRAIYMAHAAVTQMLSESKEDLQSRLALSLARKAVTERFDDDKTLDCRIPGQIFAIQGSMKDVEGIRDRPAFRESKQVYDALRNETPDSNGVSVAPASLDPTTLPPADWLYSEIDTLKHQFAALIDCNADTDIILSFATNAIRLFNTAATSLPDIRGRGKTDACFLAISALVRAFEQTSQVSHLLQAAYLAEVLLKYNIHVHEARLILVYLYMRLGLGSLAMRMFDSLSVKEIQNDTVGHALFTRLAYTNPWSTSLSKKESFDPLKRATSALAVYTRCEEKLSENEASVLSSGQTGMIFDLHELRDSLRSSLSRRIIHLEQRRIDRLVGGVSTVDTTELGPRTIANLTKVTDNRDFAATFDCGYNIEKALHGRDGVLPGKARILYSLVTDWAWCLADATTLPVVDEADSVFQELSGQSTISESMSNPEYLAGDLACQVLRFLVNPSNFADGVPRIAEALARLGINSLISTTEASSERIVDVYAYLDVVRLVIRACRPPRDEKMSGLERDARSRYAELQKYATDQAKRIKAAEVQALMKQDRAVWAAFNPFGGSAVQSFCDAVAASAKEGWEGVAKIQIA